jgi:hypothetical protein
LLDDFFMPGMDRAPVAGEICAGAFGEFRIGIFLDVCFIPGTDFAPLAGEMCFGALGRFVPFIIHLSHFCG